MTTVDRFIAIGVGQGDAFFFQRGDFTVLVDGGRENQKFFSLFRAATGQQRVNVIVCTHNDSDHAGGLISFFKVGEHTDELWLPASWFYRLEDLMSHPETFVEELIENVRNQRFPHLLEELDLSEALRQVSREEEAALTQRELDSVPTTSFSSGLPVPNEIGADVYRLLSRVAKLLGSFGGTTWRLQLLIEALKASTRIRRLAEIARRANIRVRWFRFDPNSRSGGYPNKLFPLNAHEVSPSARPSLAALFYLALTTANKESLVLFSPDTSSSPGVVFTADSDLRFTSTIPWHSGMVVTAPHHGSEHNAHAYQRFYRDTSGKVPIIWIRSDSRTRSRPGSSFRKVAGTKFCTICRNSTMPKQHVLLQAAVGQWVAASHTRKCRC